MYFSKKIHLIILLFSFLSLNGMEEGYASSEDVSNGEEFTHTGKKNKIDKDSFQEQDQVKIFEPRSLKIQVAIKAAELIDSGILNWKDLANLPEGLPELIYKFYIANTYFNNSVIEKDEEKNDEELINLIGECKALFYELIIRESDSLETFISALDEFFDFYR